MCDECDDLRAALVGRSPDDLSDEWVRQNFDQLPLLSDEAKRYFMPAYLRAALRAGGENVAEFLLYALASDHRWEPRGGYTPEQRTVVLDYLDFGKSGETGEIFSEEYEQARARWQPAI